MGQLDSDFKYFIASFLARTYGCTSFFSSPPFGVFPTEDISVEDETNAPVPPIQFDASILLTSVTTSDTQRTPHIDACLGEDLGGKAYGTILDKKGGLWQTPGADGRTGCSRVGGVNDKDSAGGQLINWGRCGTASENGSIAVGLRASVKAIDPRAGSAPPSVLLDVSHSFRWFIFAYCRGAYLSTDPDNKFCGTCKAALVAQQSPAHRYATA